jgi:phosphatidylinositol glycan class O
MVWGVIAPALIGSWQVWVLEWIESGGLQTTSTSSSFFQVLETVVGIVEPLIRLRTLRSWIARGVCALLGLGMIGWSIIPLCLDIRVRAPFSNSTSSSSTVANTSTTTQVVVLGYANAYGAPYLLFYLLSFALVYLCTPLPGQVVLGLSAVAFVAYLEALDGVRDAKEIERVVGNALNPIVGGLSDPAAKLSSSSTRAAPKKGGSGKERKADEVVEPTTFLTILPLILLSFVTFYATGHQSTIPSLQWKTGFVLSESVRYPWSVITVVLNSAGAFWVLGIVGGPFIGGWKRSPTLPPSEGSEEEGETPKLGLDITHSSILATLLIQIYFLVLLFGASMSAAVLRRHLMVWKVFAPRFIAAVLELGVVDLGVLVGVWGVGDRVVERVRWILGRVGIGRDKKRKEE